MLRHSIKLHVIFFPKTTVLRKFVVSLTIVKYNPSLTIFNDDPSLTIVSIIVNKFFFQKQSFFKNNRIKNGRKSFYKSSIRVGRIKTIFFPATKRSFLKTFEKWNKKRSFKINPTNKDIQFPQQNWVRKGPRLFFKN